MSKKLEFKIDYEKMNFKKLMMVMKLVDFRIGIDGRPMNKKQNAILNCLLKDDTLIPVLEINNVTNDSVIH